MSQTLDLTGHGMLALTRASLATLRAALLRDGGPAAAVYLQEAGYAGGDALWEAFRRWLSTRSEIIAEDLDVSTFEQRASEFFRDAGWGTLAIGTIHDAVATLDSSDWGEADPESKLDQPACHLTTGMFADLFGRLAGAPVAVLEVECRSTGASRCRFLVGNLQIHQFAFGAQALERLEKPLPVFTRTVLALLNKQRSQLGDRRLVGCALEVAYLRITQSETEVGAGLPFERRCQGSWPVLDPVTHPNQCGQQLPSGVSITFDLKAAAYQHRGLTAGIVGATQQVGRQPANEAIVAFQIRRECIARLQNVSQHGTAMLGIASAAAVDGLPVVDSLAG